MKRVILMVIMTAALSFAAETVKQNELGNAKDMLIQGVETGNLGLRCDAVFRIAELKSVFPQADMKDCVNALKKSIRKDDSSLVRTYAGLTLAYLTEQSLNQTVKVLPQETAYEFFQRLQGVMYTQVLALK